MKANIVAVTKVTKLVLPAMVERQKGVVINIGSASSAIPSPLLTVYAATKVSLDLRYSGPPSSNFFHIVKKSVSLLCS